MVGFRLF